MSETERKSKDLSKQAVGKLRIVTGKLRVRRWSPCEQPDQPDDRTVAPDQPFDLSVRIQQPDAPHAPEPRVNWT